MGLGKVLVRAYYVMTCLSQSQTESLQAKIKRPLAKTRGHKRLLSQSLLSITKGGNAMQVSDIINNQKDPIANSPLDKSFNPIANREKTTSSVIVDRLLTDYSDLIDPNYKKWFAARFYNLPFDQIHRAASEARQDGANPQKLFSFIIRKLTGGLS